MVAIEKRYVLRLVPNLQEQISCQPQLALHGAIGQQEALSAEPSRALEGAFMGPRTLLIPLGRKEATFFWG